MTIILLKAGFLLISALLFVLITNLDVSHYIKKFRTLATSKRKPIKPVMNTNKK